MGTLYTTSALIGRNQYGAAGSTLILVSLQSPDLLDKTHTGPLRFVRHDVRVKCGLYGRRKESVEHAIGFVAGG